jgi:putative cell wall-binding protein
MVVVVAGASMLVPGKAGGLPGVTSALAPPIACVSGGVQAYGPKVTPMEATTGQYIGWQPVLAIWNGTAWNTADAAPWFWSFTHEPVFANRHWYDFSTNSISEPYTFTAAPKVAYAVLENVAYFTPTGDPFNYQQVWATDPRDPSVAGVCDLGGSPPAPPAAIPSFTPHAPQGPPMFSIGTGRIAGGDRYATAAAAADLAHAGSADLVYIATGATFPDALAAAAAAGAAGAPLLLTPPDGLQPATADELSRLHPAQVVLVGGTAAISDATLHKIAAVSGATVSRVAGADRYATAAATVNHEFADAGTVFVTTGEAFPDAVVGASAGSWTESPLLLVRHDGVPASTAAELTRLRPVRIIVFGGPAAVSDATLAALQSFAPVQRVAGADRYETAAVAAATMGFAGMAIGALSVATGDDFPDALAAAPFTSPVLLVPSAGTVPSSVLGAAGTIAAREIFAIGGRVALPDAAFDAVVNASRL